MNKEHYLNIVERITTSKSFGRSATYANMLKYLVECTLTNNIPKETTIASDIFGKENFDPSQSTLIRVYVYNLRKKLTRYYENEGITDTVILKIPKGNYEVKFIDQTPTKTTVLKTKTYWVIGTILILFSLIYISRFINPKQQDLKIALWQDLLSNNKPDMVVLGDLFIYAEIDSITGKTKILRNTAINSKEEFKIDKIKTSEGITLEPLSYSYLIKNSATWIKDLSKVFFQSEKDFVIRAMSRFNTKELADNDLIVVGMLKTLGIFKDYLYKEGYSIEPDTLAYTNKKTGQKHIYSPSGNVDKYHTDYAVILKVFGPNNNNIYLFGGILDTGASQSLKNFTDYKLAQQLEVALINKFGEVPNNYKILLEVSGINRMELNSKIIHLERIN
jgi:hypothetical protein